MKCSLTLPKSQYQYRLYIVSEGFACLIISEICLPGCVSDSAVMLREICTYHPRYCVDFAAAQGEAFLPESSNTYDVQDLANCSMFHRSVPGERDS